MKWTAYPGRAGGRPEAQYLAPATGRTWAAVEKDLVEFWQKLCAEVRHHHEGHSSKEWNRIYCSLSLLSGRVVSFPGRTLATNTARVVVQQTIVLAQRTHDRLPDPDDEEQFLPAYDQLRDQVFGSLMRSAAKPAARLAIASLRAWHSFDVYGLDRDDKKTLFKMLL